MSTVIRLAQPQAMPEGAEPLSPAQQQVVQAAIAAHADVPGGLLPLLHAVQDGLGHVPAAAVADIARAVNRSRAEVHGVVTFYHHFRLQPPGKHVVQVCQAEACRACGGEALMRAAERALGCAEGETRADGGVTLEPVYCLGLCASAPALQIDDRLHARVDTARLHALVRQLQDAEEEQA